MIATSLVFRKKMIFLRSIDMKVPKAPILMMTPSNMMTLWLEFRISSEQKILDSSLSVYVSTKLVLCSLRPLKMTFQPLKILSD